MAYLAGNVITFTVTFRTESTNAAIDPTVVEFSYQTNGGSFTSPVTWNGSLSTPTVGSVARTGTGVYVFLLSTTGLSGIITGLWESTGTGQAAVEDSITIGQTVGTGLSFGDLIETVWRRVLGPVQERFALVNNSSGVGSLDGTITYDGAASAGVVPGCKISIDLEDILVVSTAGNVATVLRGYNGSTPANHNDDAPMYINASVTHFDIASAINDDISDMSAQGLYRVGVAQLTYNPVFMGYDLSALPDNFIDVLAVDYRDVSPDRRFPKIHSWDIRRWNQQVTDSVFPSGLGLILYESAYPGLPVYVTYSAPFIPLVLTTDSVINTPATNDPAPPLGGYSNPTVPNLATTMTDIPVLGATIALVQGKEISRDDMGSQPDPRKAAEVPAQALATATNPLILRRAIRISAEADRLYLKYAPR